MRASCGLVIFLPKVLIMDECSKKLIIWDFDGVIADTEKLWLENRRQMINEKFGLNWDFDTTNKHLGGMSDKTKRLNMDKLGLTTDDEFWKESMARDMAVMAKGFEATPGTEDILNCREIKQCVATGGIYSKSVEKLKTIGFWGKYINDTNLFTADMVEHGKPEPELFLLAAAKMGELPETCVVIEDSLAGMTAGLRAGMTVIAYIGCEMNNNPENIKNIRALGVKHIFSTMAEIKDFLGICKYRFDKI